jgi:hypothetical protein
VRNVLKTRPQFTRGPIQGPAAVGSLVHVNGHFAVVALAPQDPNKTLMLAAFEKGSFMHRMYGGETALIFSGDLLFEPDVSQPTIEDSPKPNSGCDVFFDGKELYVVVKLASATDWRLLTLGSGHLVSLNTRQMHVFPRYRLGVTGADGETSGP